MKDKQHITIHIADAAPIDMEISPAKEELIRKIEKDVNLMWAQWRRAFPDKRSSDVLAMAAFRYAQVYYEHIEKLKQEEEAMAKAVAALDSILLDVK